MARWRALLDAETLGDDELKREALDAFSRRRQWPDGMRRYIASLYALDVDTWQRVTDFIERNGIEYTNGIDEDGRIAVDWGVSGIPEKFFVNAEGQVVKKIVGPNTEATLSGILTDLTDEALGITSSAVR